MRTETPGNLPQIAHLAWEYSNIKQSAIRYNQTKDDNWGTGYMGTSILWGELSCTKKNNDQENTPLRLHKHSDWRTRMTRQHSF